MNKEGYIEQEQELKWFCRGVSKDASNNAYTQ